MNAVAEKPTLKNEVPQMRELKKGDRLRCEKCGMELEVTVDCKCGAGHHARLECCGQPLAQV
jgi:hypothetical protein